MASASATMLAGLAGSSSHVSHLSLSVSLSLTCYFRLQVVATVGDDGGVAVGGGGGGIGSRGHSSATTGSGDGSWCGGMVEGSGGGVDLCIFFIFFRNVCRAPKKTHDKERNLGFLLYEFLCRAPSLTHDKGPVSCVC
jgi:hypothetical protein